MSACVGCNACVVPASPRTTSPWWGRSRSRAAARCIGPASTALPGLGRGAPRPFPPADPVARPLRRSYRLPRRRDGPQRGGPQRHDLQPLYRHALLLEQLPVQGAALQLPALPEWPEPLPLQQIPRVTVRSPRGDGEVHLLHPADPFRSVQAVARQREPPRPRRRVTPGLRAGPSPSHRAIVFGDLNDTKSRVAALSGATLCSRSCRRNRARTIWPRSGTRTRSCPARTGAERAMADAAPPLVAACQVEQPVGSAGPTLRASVTDKIATSTCCRSGHRSAG